MLSVMIIVATIIQFFFMPKWENGNMETNEPSSDGVHTQTGSTFKNTDQTRKIHITN